MCNPIKWFWSTITKESITATTVVGKILRLTLWPSWVPGRPAGGWSHRAVPPDGEHRRPRTRPASADVFETTRREAEKKKKIKLPSQPMYHNESVQTSWNTKMLKTSNMLNRCQYYASYAFFTFSFTSFLSDFFANEHITRAAHLGLPWNYSIRCASGCNRKLLRLRICD